MTRGDPSLSTPLARRRRFAGLVRNTRAVVIVEFVVAIVPIVVLFFSIAQLSVIAYVHLVVKHSAYVAARTEAVVHPQMPDSGQESDVKAAVMMLLTAIPGVAAGDVNVQTQTAGQYEENIDTVTVTLTYRCTVPLANRFMCASGSFPIHASASFPNQGSSYQQIWQGS
jgi:hypothetical protein